MSAHVFENEARTECKGEKGNTTFTQQISRSECALAVTQPTPYDTYEQGHATGNNNPTGKTFAKRCVIRHTDQTGLEPATNNPGGVAQWCRSVIELQAHTVTSLTA
jgi:hypothetical protein